jgi:anti-sigma28 factor (negative regulator of flagellin synthesis)
MSEIERDGREQLTGAAAGRDTLVAALVARLKALPDVRAERVASLRAQVAAGTYRPAAAEIAAAILRHEILSRIR